MIVALVLGKKLGFLPWKLSDKTGNFQTPL
jgi:hypothetical protein